MLKVPSDEIIHSYTYACMYITCNISEIISCFKHCSCPTMYQELYVPINSYMWHVFFDISNTPDIYNTVPSSDEKARFVLLVPTSGVVQCNSAYWLYFWHKRGPTQAGVCRRKRTQTLTELNNVELSRPAALPANQKRDVRSLGADALLCDGDAWTYTFACL